MSDKKEFIGVIGPERHLVKTLRSCFTTKYGGERSFDICPLHNVENYDHRTFAGWASSMHCKNLTPEDEELLKLYLVNYFMYPDMTDELELIAKTAEVFPTPPPEPKPKLQVIKPSIWEIMFGIRRVR